MRLYFAFSIALVWMAFGPRPALAQGPPPAPVEIEVIGEAEIVPTVQVLGTTEPKRRSVVAAAIEGYVIGYPIDEGQRVKAGDLLTRLRDRTLQLQLKQAEAALAEIRERHKNAKRDLERARDLIRTDAVTQRTLDARETEERTLALQIAQTEAQVDILKEDIQKKQITAPYAGQIVREHTEVGEWVAKGGPVATLVDIASVFVRVNVPERSVRFLSEGQTAHAVVEAAAEEPFPARVVSVPDEGDPISRTFPVRVEIDNPGTLRAGLSAQVELPAGRAERALVVSKDAVLLDGTQSYVFVVAEGNRAERRPVRTGVAAGNRFAVLDGLRPGEKVIVKGNERIRPGAPVRILPASARAPQRD